jgi:hypothetical protein
MALAYRARVPDENDAVMMMLLFLSDACLWGLN